MYYLQSEYAEMHYFYGYARGNARLAARLYRTQGTRRGGLQPETFPDYRVFLRVHNAYMDGRLPGASNREGTIRRNPEHVETVLEEVIADPSTSTRAISRQTRISQPTVQRILRQQNYHPYHIRKVQDLLPTDHRKRVDFCEEVLRRDRDDPDFLIIFFGRTSPTSVGMASSMYITIIVGP